MRWNEPEILSGQDDQIAAFDALGLVVGATLVLGFCEVGVLIALALHVLGWK